MIRHIVMWQLKDEAEGKSKQENAAIIKKSLEALEGIVPQLRSIKVGINMQGTPENNFDVVLNCTLDDLAALSAYQVNPEHQKVVAYIVKVVSARVCVDYEE